MITGTQIRAARALLGWSCHRFSNEVGLSYACLQRAEAQSGVPGMVARNLYRVERTLSDAGIIFTEDTASIGVAIRREALAE